MPQMLSLQDTHKYFPTELLRIAHSYVRLASSYVREDTGPRSPSGCAETSQQPRGRSGWEEEPAHSLSRLRAVLEPSMTLS